MVRIVVGGHQREKTTRRADIDEGDALIVGKPRQPDAAGTSALHRDVVGLGGFGPALVGDADDAGVADHRAGPDDDRVAAQGDARNAAGAPTLHRDALDRGAQALTVTGDDHHVDRFGAGECCGDAIAWFQIDDRATPAGVAELAGRDSLEHTGGRDEHQVFVAGRDEREHLFALVGAEDLRGGRAARPRRRVGDVVGRGAQRAAIGCDGKDRGMGRRHYLAREDIVTTGRRSFGTGNRCAADDAARRQGHHARLVG